MTSVLTYEQHTPTGEKKLGDITLRYDRTLEGSPDIEAGVNMIRHLDPNILQHVRSVRWKRATMPSDRQVAMEGGSALRLENGDYALEIIIPDRIVTPTPIVNLTHEVGHVVDNWDPRIQDLMWMAMKLDGNRLPRRYALTNSHEQTADAIQEMHARMGPAAFRNHYPHRARVIDAVLAGQVGSLKEKDRMQCVALLLAAMAAHPADRDE